MISSLCSCHRRLTAHVKGSVTSWFCSACQACIIFCMLAKGFELPCWMATMAVGIPANVADGFRTRLEVASRGMVRILKMQHGTTKVSWGDIIVALHQCHNDGLEPDGLQEALNERAPAFHDMVADWRRIR